MQCITNQRYKTIDLSENNKSLNQLETEFQQKYVEIQRYKHDPTCDKYHKLYDELTEIQAERTKLATMS